MIAKRIPIKQARQSSFRRLVQYLTDPQNKQERVGETTITNCVATDVEWATMEVLGTQAQNTRSKADKTYHLLISFPSGEQPARDVLQDIEARLAAGLGYAEHQRISVAHHDTDHFHLHVAINKIHPTRFTSHEPYFDYKRLATLCASLEQEYGLQIDNHQAARTPGQTKAADMERAAGVESLLGWIARHCLTDLLAADSWDRFHAVLAEHDLAAALRGNGLVISDQHGHHVKASSVSRQCSKAALEKRFGPYRASTIEAPAARKRYRAKPLVSTPTSDRLFAEYQASVVRRRTERTDTLARLRAARDRAVNDARRRARLKRQVIKLGRGPGKRVLYQLTTKALRAELNDIYARYRHDRNRGHAGARGGGWTDWLVAQASAGRAEALAVLRGAQRPTTTTNGIYLASAGDGAPLPGATVSSITRRGTYLYRMGQAMVRDDGARLTIADGASDKDLATILAAALRRYGGPLHIDGSVQFKVQIQRVAKIAKIPVRVDDDGGRGERPKPKMVVVQPRRLVGLPGA